MMHHHTQEDPIVWSKMTLNGLGTQRMIDTGYLTFRGTIEDGTLSLLLRMMLKGESDISKKAAKEGVFGSTLALEVDPSSPVYIGKRQVKRLLCCLLPRHLKRTGSLSTEFVFSGPDGLITNEDAGIPNDATPAYDMSDVKLIGDLRVGMVDPDCVKKLTGKAVQVLDKDLKKRIENTDAKFRQEGEPPRMALSNTQWRDLTGPDVLSKVLPELPSEDNQTNDADQSEDLQEILNKADPSVFENIEKILFKGRAPTLGQVEMLTVANFPNLQSIVMEPHLVLRKIIEFPNYAKAFAEMKKRCRGSSKEAPSLRFWNRIWGSVEFHLISFPQISTPLVKYLKDVREVHVGDGLKYRHLLADLKHKEIHKVVLNYSPVQYLKSVDNLKKKIPSLKTVTFNDDAMKTWIETNQSAKEDPVCTKWTNVFNRIFVAGISAPLDNVVIRLPSHIRTICEPERIVTMKIGTKKIIKWRCFAKLKTLLIKCPIEENLIGINRENMPELDVLKLCFPAGISNLPEQIERIRKMGVQVKVLNGVYKKRRGKPSKPSKKSTAQEKRAQVIAANNAQVINN